MKKIIYSTSKKNIYNRNMLWFWLAFESQLKYKYPKYKKSIKNSHKIPKHS